MAKRYLERAVAIVDLTDVGTEEPPERFTTLSPMLASYNADHLADPPCFDGRVPPDPVGFLPGREQPGKRGDR